MKNAGDILSTHESHYLIEGKTIIITYGPSSEGPYIVTGIKISEEKYRAGAINSFNYRDVQLMYLESSLRKLQAVYNLELTVL